MSRFRSLASGFPIRAATVVFVLSTVIEDDGPGLAPDAGDGIGLANLRARLAELYGSNQRLELASRSGGGTTVEVRIPWRSSAR